jgi:hypothetical protein
MVSRKTYERISEVDWKKCLVKTNTVLRNGHEEIPAGTICRVTGKRGGLRLETEPCKCCGIKVFITKVPPEAVEVWRRSKGE